VMEDLIVSGSTVFIEYANVGELVDRRVLRNIVALKIFMWIICLWLGLRVFVQIGLFLKETHSFLKEIPNIWRRCKEEYLDE